MRSASVIAVCLLVLVACMSLSGMRGVSADGSIQPFKDNQCQTAAANVTLIPIVSWPGCQWVTVHDTLIAFSYLCYPGQYGNFSMSFWTNSSIDDPCYGTQDFSINSQFGEYGYNCATANYQDANTNVAFYAELQCYASWSEAAPEQVTEQSATAPESLLHALTSLIPQTKSSAIHRLARQIAGKQTL